MPIFDIRCDTCGHTEEDYFGKGGEGAYGDCPACVEAIHILTIQGIAEPEDELNPGTMRQMLCAPAFNMNPESSIRNMSGRTKNGTKWEVGSKLSKYSASKGGFTGDL